MAFLMLVIQAAIVRGPVSGSLVGRFSQVNISVRRNIRTIAYPDTCTGIYVETHLSRIAIIFNLLYRPTH